MGLERRFSLMSDNQMFVQGLPTDATEEEIALFFGSIGVMKNNKKRKQRIFISKDIMSWRSQ